MAVSDLTPRVREALSVSADYDAETIPAAIRRAVKRLLRDYHFPKSMKRRTFTGLVVGEQNFPLPPGFKKALNLQFFDPTSVAWGEPLLRRDGFVQPTVAGFPKRYWLEGTRLWVDTPLPEGYDTAQLLLWYESQDVDLNEDWITDDFEDVLFNFVCYREATAIAQKPELAQTFAALWAEDQKSLAIYLNELEWGGMEMSMRETRDLEPSRYPTCG